MVSAVGCVCAGALQNHVAECKGRFSSHWHCWWCGCREGATSAKAPGPDMADQLCSLCGAAHKGGASAPIRRAEGGYDCPRCLRHCRSVEAYRIHTELCEVSRTIIVASGLHSSKSASNNRADRP